MPFALEVALDPDSAAVVRAAWRELATAGFPFMADSGAAPHVSLAIWDQIDVAAMSAAVADWSRGTAELAIVFDRVAVFPATGVVFLAPVADIALRDVQARCHQHLAPHGRQPWPLRARRVGAALHAGAGSRRVRCPRPRACRRRSRSARAPSSSGFTRFTA
jgi:hypothetical protein